ncbi:MAG: hypothetical protein GX601_01280 [Anaerolineales bacterium]|nr:hypothetical protein [Anaerolineales bacterium]
MTRRRASRRTSRRLVNIHAPRKGTLALASALYLLGVFGGFDLIPTLKPYALIALTVAGGLLILGVLLRDL